MKLLVTGAAGMLGRRVVADAHARGWHAVGADLQGSDVSFDLLDEPALSEALKFEAPDVIIHCAAYTAVDLAEEHEDVAQRVNAQASRNIARAANAAGARIVGVSTDYVFDGQLTGRPYVESDATAPINAYGRSKLAGELAIAEETDDYAIGRTAWLFGWPGKSLPDTLLRAAETRPAVSVVTDQVGSPTWTGHLSQALLALADSKITGVVHTAGGGQCSWNELITEVFKQAGVDCPVHPTTADQFPTPAKRPAWSVLATERDAAPVLPDWREGVAGYLNERGAGA